MLKRQGDDALLNRLGRSGRMALGNGREILEPGQAVGLEAALPLIEAGCPLGGRSMPAWRQALLTLPNSWANCRTDRRWCATLVAGSLAARRAVFPLIGAAGAVVLLLLLLLLISSVLRGSLP